MENSNQIPVKVLLELAVRAEIDSNSTYGEIAQRLRNPLLKEKLLWLASEEAKHKVILENLFGVLFPDEELIVPDRIQDGLIQQIVIAPSSTLADLLHQAMDSEQAAETFYAGLAKKVQDPQKKILDYLSKVEHSHFAMLKSEYIVALEFEDYAEKGIDKVIT